jgi:hypothetical protein
VFKARRYCRERKDEATQEANILDVDSTRKELVARKTLQHLGAMDKFESHKLS